MTMIKYGLIGYPLGHSFSQKYFSEKFINEHIEDCVYENYPLKDINQLTSLITSEPELRGLNVTIPYKSEVLRFLDKIDDEAAEIGAVNVIKIKRTGKNVILSGFNSDTTGIRDSIKPYISGGLKNALVLGTGGSSRSVCYVLKDLGLTVKQVSRERREGVITYSDITPGLIDDTGLIVNTTPLGMFPAKDGKPELNYDLLTSRQILFDLVYNPEITAFLESGLKRGCTIITGLKMLHSQAEKSWEIWNDDNL
jgi:shikimate dehydrogenase